MLQRFRTPQPSNRRASMGCLTILEHPKLVEGVWRSWKRSDVLWEAVQIQSLEGIKDGGSNPRQAKFLSGSGCDLARLCQFLSGELPRVFEFLTQNLSGEDVPFSKFPKFSSGLWITQRAISCNFWRVSEVHAVIDLCLNSQVCFLEFPGCSSKPTLFLNVHKH